MKREGSHKFPGLEQHLGGDVFPHKQHRDFEVHPSSVCVSLHRLHAWSLKAHTCQGSDCDAPMSVGDLKHSSLRCTCSFIGPWEFSFWGGGSAFPH